MIAFTASAIGLLGLAHTGIQASIVEAPLVATVFQVELQQESDNAPLQASPETAETELIEMLPSTAHLSTPRQETLHQIATSGRVLTESEIRILARAAGWPDYTLDELLEVAWCESNYNPTAMNGTAIHGLMQVHTLWFNYSGIDRSQWSNALVNLEVALAAYNYDLQQGHAPWTQWQCRPGGIRVPTEEFAPHLPDVALEDGEPGDSEAASEDGEGSATADETPSEGESGEPSGEPTPEPTPAPWDAEPSWPPPADGGDSEGGDAPVEDAPPQETPATDPAPEATAEPSPAGEASADEESVTEPGVVTLHQPDAPSDSSAP